MHAPDPRTLGALATEVTVLVRRHAYSQANVVVIRSDELDTIREAVVVIAHVKLSN
jgi:hypothetical protein